MVIFSNHHLLLGSKNCISEFVLKFDPVQNILFHLVTKNYYTIFIPEPRALNIAVQLLSKVTILIVVSYQTHLQSQRAHAQYYVRCMLNAQLGLLARPIQAQVLQQKCIRYESDSRNALPCHFLKDDAKNIGRASLNSVALIVPMPAVAGASELAWALE